MADYGGPGNIFLQGFGLGSSSAAQSMNTDLRRQQLISEDRSRRLQEAQTAQHMSMLMEEHSKQVDYAAAMAKAAGQISLSTAPTIPDEGPDGIVDVPNPNRLSFVDAQAKFALPVLAKYDPKLYEAQALRQEKNDSFTPGFTELTDPSGKTHIVFQQSKNASQLLPTDPTISTITGPDGNDVQVFNPGKGASKLMPQDIGERQRSVAVLKFAMDKMPEKVQFDESGKAFVAPEDFPAIAKAAGITTGTRSKLEQADIDASNVFSIGQKLAPLLTPDNSGLRGLTSRLSEAAIGQLFPGMKIGKASETAAVATEFGAKLTRALRSDGNIAEPERESILSALPRPQDWKQSSQQAKVKLADALEQAGDTSRNGANMRGKPITSYWLKPEEIATAFKSGQITEAQADKFMENNAWRLIKTLRQTAQR